MAAPAKPAPKKPATPAAKSDTKQLLFGKQNYLLMIIGIVVIAFGFVLMTGGGSEDPKIFNKEEIYSFRRTTLSTIVILLGFVIEIFAIMRRPKGEAGI